MTAFFIDENLSPDLAPVLRSVFRQHRFLIARETGLLGIDDVELFRELRYRDIDCLITLDKNQLSREVERDGLREAGLHWLGISDEVEGRGVRRIAAYLAMAGPGIAYVLDHWQPRPTAYHCTSPPGQAVASKEPL